MNRLKDFWERKVNVVELADGLMLGRESTGVMDYMTISFGGEVLYGWWHNPDREVRKGEPKHTGGKKPYAKLMLQELEKRKDITLEAAGAVVKLLPHIDWKNNRIINKRSKKPLAAEDFMGLMGIGHNKLYKILGELKDRQVIEKVGGEYRLSPYLIQKGATDNDSKG